MPGRMGEVPGQFSLAQHTPRGAIYFAGGRARANRRDGCLLRFQHGLIQPSSFRRRRSDMHSAGAIRAITGEYNTKITDHEPAGNARARGPAMHNRRARSGSEYGRKRHAFGPGTPGLVLHGGGDFDLTHTRPNLVASNLKKTGAEFDRPPDAQNLGRVLHHAGTLDQRGRETQSRLPFQHRGYPVTPAGGDRLRFDAHPRWRRASSLRGQPLRRRQQRGLTRDGHAHILDVRILYFVFCLGAVASVCKKDGTTIPHHQRSRTASKATEIANIGEVSDEQGVELVARERGLEPAQAPSVVHRRSVARSSCQLPVAGCQLPVASNLVEFAALPLATGGWQLATASQKRSRRALGGFSEKAGGLGGSNVALRFELCAA